MIGRHELTGDAVQPANADGARRLGEHLYGLGHRTIGVIAGPKELTTTTDRLDRPARRPDGRRGQPAAAPDRVRRLQPRRRRRGGRRRCSTRTRPSPRSSRSTTRWRSAHWPSPAARGLSVPGDLSVVGFDDMPIAQDVTPSLTTVRLPLVEMGARALTLALGTHSRGPLVETAPAEVVVRDSAGPPRAG